jgi:plastocyanin
MRPCGPCSVSWCLSGRATAGATVQVTNNDSEAHPVTADSGQDFDTTVQPGKTASFAAPKQAGSYRSHRNLHSKHAWHP